VSGIAGMAETMDSEKRGTLIVLTGDGKGKTTSAVGCMLRALGQGMRVCMIQFLKGPWRSGELDALRSFGDRAEVHAMGLGFTWDSPARRDEHVAAAKGAWAFAERLLSAPGFDVLVLDELTYLVKHGILSDSEVLNAIRGRPAGMHVVVTGRDASSALIEAADIATEMKQLRHQFDSGAASIRGIEF